jgi:peptidoglycan/LPS O-acetylase OafA/YrhL
MRLYPLFLIALLLGWATTDLYGPVIGASHFGAPAADNFAIRGDVLERDFWPHLLLHLTMLHGAIPDSVLPLSALSFSGPLWSISLEWQFYLVAPFLAYVLDFRRRGRWPLIVLSLIIIELLRFTAKAYWTAKVPAFLPMRLDLFALGILCAHGWDWARTARLPVLAALVVAVLALLRGLGHNWLPLLIWSGTYMLAATGDRYRVTALANRLYTLALFRWIGERSYGLYVLHMPIMLSFAWFVVLPLGLNQVATLAALAAAFPLVLAAAALCYRYVERPTIHWARGLAQRSPGHGAVPIPETG